MRTRASIDAQVKALIWAGICSKLYDSENPGPPQLPGEGSPERDFLDGAVNMAVDILFLGERIATALETMATPATVTAVAEPDKNKRDIIGMKG